MLNKKLEQIIVSRRAEEDEPLNGDEIEELVQDIKEKIQEHEGDVPEENKRVISCLECGNNLFNVEELITRQMRSHYEENSKGKEHTLDREGGEEAVIDKIRCTNCDADMKAHILETESRTGIELVFNW